MILTDQACAEFYRLRQPFLDYCRTRLPLTATQAPVGLSSEEKVALEVIQAVRHHPEIFDQYHAENPHKLGPADQQVVRRWKDGVVGDFIIVRFLKKGAVLAENEKPNRYFLVLGISDSVEELCAGQSPVMIQANLLPFDDALIVDGYFQLYNLSFGAGAKRNLNAGYQVARKAGKIWSNLDGVSAIPKPAAVRKEQPDWKTLIDPIVRDCQKLRGADSETLSAAFSLLRASAQLSQAVVDESDHAEIKKKLSTIRRAFTAFQNSYYSG